MIGAIHVYADEDVNIAVIEGLKRRGFQASTARDFGNLGTTDEEHLHFAQEKNFVILTHDTDFLKLIHENKIHHPGIFFAPQGKYSVRELIRKIETLLSILTLKDMENHIEFL